jgi:hypothetical protein
LKELLGFSSKGGKSDVIKDFDDDERGSFKTNPTNSEDQRLKELLGFSSKGGKSDVIKGFDEDEKSDIVLNYDGKIV